ncbi:MAG: hypothetical protein ACP5NZ_04085 [Nanobdellota archaeon]
MKKYRKILLSCLIFLGICLLLTSPVNSLQSYDQRVYKIDSNYKQERDYNQKTYYSCQEREIKKYQNYNRYPLFEHQNRKYIPTTRLSYTKDAYEDTRKGTFGDYVKEYVVDIRNTGDTGRYFTVKFELEHKNGYKYVQTVTRYLRGSEREKFVYRDTQYERNEILDWDYTIIPQK